MMKLITSPRPKIELAGTCDTGTPGSFTPALFKQEVTGIYHRAKLNGQESPRPELL
jgi:hypothetical protein